jgi:hypothetical protein
MTAGRLSCDSVFFQGLLAAGGHGGAEGTAAIKPGGIQVQSRRRHPQRAPNARAGARNRRKYVIQGDARAAYAHPGLRPAREGACPWQPDPIFQRVGYDTRRNADDRSSRRRSGAQPVHGDRHSHGGIFNSRRPTGAHQHGPGRRYGWWTPAPERRRLFSDRAWGIQAWPAQSATASTLLTPASLRGDGTQTARAVQHSIAPSPQHRGSCGCRRCADGDGCPGHERQATIGLVEGRRRGSR